MRCGASGALRLPCAPRIFLTAQLHEIYVINVFTNIDFEGKKSDT
uniref:Uncharacterized protein n=1 Tax=Salmonella enterica subsp. enterica serovar Kottbus TaxID=224727 RepID=A0A8F1IFW5_SALET|nr:hypothetical protein [Salmonella enterica subsp. enterica serovar Kottbus]